MITIQNIKVNVTRAGNNESAVVLLHGWGQNQYMMKFLQDHLCDTFTVINLDLPGFGESEEPPRVWSVDDYVDFLQELLDHLQITHVSFIAHSFGARIALRYAYRFPVEKMVLTGAAGIQAKRGLGYHIRVKTYKLLKKLHAAPAMGSSDYQSAGEKRIRLHRCGWVVSWRRNCQMPPWLFCRRRIILPTSTSVYSSAASWMPF